MKVKQRTVPFKGARVEKLTTWMGKKVTMAVLETWTPLAAAVQGTGPCHPS